MPPERRVSGLRVDSKRAPKMVGVISRQSKRDAPRSSWRISSVKGGMSSSPRGGAPRTSRPTRPSAFFAAELRYVYLLGKESAVGVGESGELRLQIGVARGDGRVEDAEEREEPGAEELGRRRLHEAAEAVLGEDAGVLGVEAEDEPDAEPVQRGERFGTRLGSRSNNRIIE